MSASFQPFSKIEYPFSIGLKPLPADIWLWSDRSDEEAISTKEALYRDSFSSVFRAEDDTTESQCEVLELIGSHSPRPIPKEFASLPPLARAALKVADDLVIMRRDEIGWRLVAASLCFPSSWTLSEKFGLPMEKIHEPVPGMEGRMNERIRRIFDNLQKYVPVWRENWSLVEDDLLRQDPAEGHVLRQSLNPSEPPPLWLRCEYQTLTRLPVSGDILFTIRIIRERVRETLQRENGTNLVNAILANFEQMDDDGRDYKRLPDTASILRGWLEAQTAKDEQDEHLSN